MYSKGVVTLSKISASNNASGSYGVYVDNTYGATPGVSISGTSTAYNQFNHNGVDGIYIYSDGAISVKYSNFIENLERWCSLLSTIIRVPRPGVTVANSNLH